MQNDITVRVIDRKRKFFYMRAELPDGSRQERSTRVRTGGNKRRKEAERAAAVWEAELREGRFKSPSKVTWAEFVERYEREALSGLADRTAEKAGTVLDQVEKILRPRRLADVTAGRLSHFQTVLRERGRAEDTIKGVLGHLKAALRWAGKMGLMHDVPRIAMPRRAKGADAMRGRAPTCEEFERMLLKVDTVCCGALLRRKTRQVIKLVKRGTDIELAKNHATLEQRITSTRSSWEHLLRGLWWSGLRLDEAMKLSWDVPGTTRIDTSGRFVMLRIRAENEKGHKDRLYPVSPEFAEMIHAVDEADRTGWFFNPVGVRGNRPRSDTVSKTITAIGRRANVLVDPDGKTPKHASAHDLRRAFGFRWSERIMPAQLKEMMRHESISTTMTYYVGRNAEATAASIYAAARKASEIGQPKRNPKSLGDTSGDTSFSDGGPANEETPQTM
jgi:site-specific recombinase XerD